MVGSPTPLLRAKEESRSIFIMDPRRWTSEERRRLLVLAASTMVGVCSGSNYVYSAYAPQLATQLHLSSTQVNLVGLAGNAGMYTMGPFWGKLVDHRGPFISLLSSGGLLLLGYSIVHAFYAWPLPIHADTPIGTTLLAFGMFLTGTGGAAGNTAGMNTVAKSFTDKTRASATGLVLAGFGLSAFLYSSIGHALFKGDAGGLLLLLSLGTSIPVILASFVVRPVPPTHDTSKEGYEPLAHDEEGLSAHSRTNSLELTRSRSPVPRGRHAHPHAHAHFELSEEEEGTEHQRSGSSTSYKPSHTRSSSLASLGPTAIADSPLQVMRKLDFWQLAFVLATLCGAGLMYINNVGSVALALARGGQMQYDQRVVGGWQAKQVATLSVWNCSGRIIGGLYSDTMKARFRLARIWFLPIVAGGFLCTQLLALNTRTVEHLWIVSTLMGLFYGSLFNVLPMLVLEWFGMAHFSQNYGWMCVSPVVGGNLFNIVFGRVYDSNTVSRIGAPAGTDDGMISDVLRRAGASVPDDDAHACLLGTACYASAFNISAFGSFLALCTSVWAGVRRERKSRERRRASTLERVEEDVTI